MTYTEEASHLRRAYLQLNEAGRADLVGRVRQLAESHLRRFVSKNAAALNNDDAVCLAVFVRQSNADSTETEKRAADLLRACVAWQEAPSQEGVERIFSLIGFLDMEAIAQGGKFRQAQSEKAKKPRGAIEGHHIKDVIRVILRSNPGETNKQLWVRLAGELDVLCGEQPTEKKKESGEAVYQYEHPTAGKKTLAYETFSKYLNQVKQEENPRN